MTTKSLSNKLYTYILKPLATIIFDLLIYQYLGDWHTILSVIPKHDISINLSLDTIFISIIFLLIESIVEKYSSYIFVKMSGNKYKVSSIESYETTDTVELQKDISNPTKIYILISVKNGNWLTSGCKLKVKFPKFVKAICGKQVTNKIHNSLYFKLTDADLRVVPILLLPNKFQNDPMTLSGEVKTSIGIFPFIKSNYLGRIKLLFKRGNENE